MRYLPLLALVTVFLSIPAVAAAETRIYAPPACGGAGASRSEEELLRCFAPAFVAPESELSHNRIGTPVLERRALGGLRVRIDPDRPTLYAEVRHDRIGDSSVLQLVYRVHFEKIPLRWSPHFFEAHHNVGLLVLVTLDEREHRPLFVTTVHTCGCYLGIMATGHVPRKALPERWRADRVTFYGHPLPSVVPAPVPGRERAVAFLESHSHRFDDLQVVSTLPQGSVHELELRPLSELRNAPVEGDAAGRTGSIFYARGPLAGHVRGAWNPFEGLTAFGAVSLDPSVGMDKDFGDPRVTGTPFYTRIGFFSHQASRLDRFDSVLRGLGFATDLIGGTVE